MTGCPGKWPLKNGSLRDTSFRAITRSSPISSTRSTRRNGYRCGRIRSMATISSTAACLLLGRLLRGRRRRRAPAGLAGRAVVAPDQLVGEVQVGLREHQRRSVDDHAEVLGRSDLRDDLGHALEDLGRLLLFLARQVLLVAHVRALHLLQLGAQLGFLLTHLVGAEQRALLVQVLDLLLQLVLLLVQLLLLLIEVLLE